MQSLFSNSHVVDTKVDLTVRGAGSIKAAFNGCSRLIRIPSLILEVPITDCANAFANCSNLEEINITTTGNGCIAATVDLKQCTKLSKASIESIINALSSTTSGLSITLSGLAVRTAFQNYNEDGEGIEDGDASNAWEALKATKPNWTISLVY